MKRTTGLEAVEAISVMLDYLTKEKKLAGKYEEAAAIMEAHVKVYDLKLELLKEDMLCYWENR